MTTTLMLCVLLSSCGGIGLVSPLSSSSPDFRSSDSAFSKTMRTRADIESLYWPSTNEHQRKMVGGRERITFRHERRWCGFFVFVVPVMLPVCTTYDRFYLVGDRVVKAKYRELRMLGFFCHFPFPLPDGRGSRSMCSTRL